MTKVNRHHNKTKVEKQIKLLEILFDDKSWCDACGGSSCIEVGDKVRACPICQGTGIIHHHRRTPNLNNISRLLEELLIRLSADLIITQTIEEARAAASKLLGRNGTLTAFNKQVGNLPADKRQVFLKMLNEAKEVVSNKLEARLAFLEKNGDL